MAAEPRTYLAAAIIIGVFSLVGLFGGIAIPLIERGKLNSQITSDQMLTREQSLAWGSVPGTRNINYQKTFTIFSLNGTDSTDILQGRANLVEVASATYNYTYQYSKLQFTPATNGSVQFYNFYNHTYEGANETDLMNQMVSTVDIGIFRGITQQANMSPAQIFVQSLYRIYTSFQQDIVTLLISEYVYQFYIKDKDLTYSTIFLYNNTVSQDLADALWNDAEYGWSKSDTLLPWVALSMNYNTGATSYNPANNPEYTLLKSHFGLTDAQMLALINGNYAAPSVPSMLYLVIYAVQNAVSGVNGCQLTTGCTNIEMFAAQFFVGNITKNPAFEGVAPKNSIAQINETYPIAPEIAAVNPQNVDFGSTLPGQLFNLNGNLPANTVQTLFGLQNIEMILANQNNTQAVTTNMNLDNTQQAQVLIDYVNYIINEFAYFGQNNTQAAKYTADVAVNNINNLIGDMGGLMSINLTAMGTYNYMLHQGQNCSVLLQGLDPSIIQAACSNPDYTLDSAHGQASWIAAYFAGDGSTAYTLIEGATGIADSDLQYMLTNQSNAWVPSNATALFYANIQAVISAMAQAFGCGQGPCDNTFISKVQWATSGVTSKLPIPYFPQTYESLSDIPAFQAHFGLFVPEFTVFAKRVLNQNINMTLDQANALLSYDSGSINNNYEMLRLVMMAQSSNYTGIQDRFNLDQSETAALFAYLDSAFMNYTLGGLIQNVSAYDLLWGYTDPFLETLNNQNFFDNIQIFNAEVSVLGGKDNSDDSSDVPYNMINSGSDNSQNVRQMTAYNGNATLSLNQTHFDGNNYFSAFEPVWNGDLQYITGTDGSGFAPLLETNTPVSIFEGPFLRNLNYNYQTTITKEYNSHSYDFNQYQFDTTQLTASNIYLNNVDGYMNLTVFDNTPLLISLPYFKACAPSSYSSITFSNQDPNTFQSSVDPGTITVEALTGITDTFTKSYQYNIYNSLPFFLNTTNNVAAIPLFQVTEKYTTPVANYERDLQSYYSRSKGITIAMIVVLVISFLLMVTSGILFRLYHVNRKKLDASRLNANPGDYASLGVDSDGARSSLHPLTQG